MIRKRRVTFNTSYGRISFLVTPKNRKKKVTAFTFPAIKKVM